MKAKCIILFLSCALFSSIVSGQQTSFDFYGERISFTRSSPAGAKLMPADISGYISTLDNAAMQSAVTTLRKYKDAQRPDDWLFYQLIRRTAQAISPKAEDYLRYTACKWFLLNETGYDAILTASAEKVLFYIRTDEHIYNIPSRVENGAQYVCLNYHDYSDIDFEQEQFQKLLLPSSKNAGAFSYKIKSLPSFDEANYVERDIQFRYYHSAYQFRIKVTPDLSVIFKNYPVVDYESYFNIPLSQATYASLIPALKKNLVGMNQKNGVDYLMRFTRYAFLFAPDTEVFGGEKRLSPEQTLLYEQSDCDDRAALFFYLVKEIYDLPMLVLAYPKHVSIAVKFDKPIGRHIVHNGLVYSICEPTPQSRDLPIGQAMPELANARFDIAYSYTPLK